MPKTILHESTQQRNTHTCYSLTDAGEAAIAAGTTANNSRERLYRCLSFCFERIGLCDTEGDELQRAAETACVLGELLEADGVGAAEAIRLAVNATLATNGKEALP